VRRAATQKKGRKKQKPLPLFSHPPLSCLSQSDEIVFRFPSLPSADPTTTTIRNRPPKKRQDDEKGANGDIVFNGFVHLPEELGECCDALDGVRESWAGPAPIPVGGLPP